MALRELLASFSIDAGPARQALKELDIGIEKAKGAIGGFSAVVAGAVAGFGALSVKHFIKDQIDIGSKLSDTSEKLGLGTEELQMFQFAVGQVGVDVEHANTALAFLSRNLGNATLGGKASNRVLSHMGLEIRDLKEGAVSVTDILPEVADRFTALKSDSERAAFAMKFFGKNGSMILPILNKGGHELRALYDEFRRLGGGMKKDFIDAADKVGDEIGKLEFVFQGLKSQVMLALLPTMTEWVTKLTDSVNWLRKAEKHTNAAKHAWQALIPAIVGASGALFLMFPYVGLLAALAAGVGFLFLKFDDLATAIEGGKSLLGDFLKAEYGEEEAKRKLEVVKEAWVGLKEATKDAKRVIVDTLKDVFDTKDETEAWLKGIQVMTKVVQGLAAAFTVASTAIKKFVEWYIHMLKLTKQLWTGDGIGLRDELGDTLRDTFNFDDYAKAYYKVMSTGLFDPARTPTLKGQQSVDPGYSSSSPTIPWSTAGASMSMSPVPPSVTPNYSAAPPAPVTSSTTQVTTGNLELHFNGIDPNKVDKTMVREAVEEAIQKQINTTFAGIPAYSGSGTTRGRRP